MASSYVPLLLVFLMASLVPVSVVASLPHRLRVSASDIAALEAAAPPRPPAPADQPAVFFEVDRPHRPPPGSFGPCSTLLLSHSFAYTYGKPPATAAYSPPPCLAAAAAGGRASAISLAVLEWRAACRGVQFDRVFGVWLGGAELLRGCTAEPSPSPGGGGVEWTVSKDVTKYASLLAAGDPTTLAVYLGNIVDHLYTGVFHANVTLHLYFRHPPPAPPQPGLGPADAVVPVSRSLPLNDGLWFEIENDLDVATASVTVPANTYRAVLEVYLSYHSDDEFWYADADGKNGPFREVVVRIDGDLVGVVWPFPVVYTGGVSPLLWRPITGIGSFSLPSYDIELTAFLGKLLDGEKQHEVAFTVTNGRATWLVDGNLHLWLDPSGKATAAGMVSYDAPPLDTATATQPEGPDEGLYYTTAFRRVSAAGWVRTPSYGTVTATWTQRLGYENTITFRDSFFQPEVKQATDAYSAAHVVAGGGAAGGVVYAQEAQQSFALYRFVGVVNQTDADSYTAAIDVRLAFSEERVAAGRSAFWSRSLRNSQECDRDVDVEDGEAVRESWGARQTYRYEASDACYFRNVTSRGYDVVYDHSDEACVKGPPAAAAAAGGIAERAAAARALRLSLS